MRLILRVAVCLLVFSGLARAQQSSPPVLPSNLYTTLPSGSGSGSTAALSGLGGAGIWQKMGTIIYADPTSATDQGASSEATVICEGSPQVLTGGETTVCGPPGTTATANAVLKMWFTCGWVPGNVCYAEARPSHPKVWFRRAGAPLITNHFHSRVFKNGATYHLYGAGTCDGSGVCSAIDHYTSTDGIVWALSQATVLSLGAGGAWDSLNFGNTRVWIEGSTWYMLYEAIKTAGQWSTGIATSTDGVGNAWTKNIAVNPLCTGCGGPFKYKDAAGTYWVWTHSAPAGSSLPSDVFRWNLTGLTSTPALVANPATSVLPRSTLDEGWQSVGTGQLADEHLLEVNNRTYAFYEGTYDGNTKTGNIHMKYAVSDLPLSAIVATNEGISPIASPWDFPQGVTVGLSGVSPPPGGLCVNSSTKVGYPALCIQDQSINGTADQGFIGFNEWQSPTGAVTRTLAANTAARIGCGVSTSNTTGGGCFWGITNTGGTEGFPIQGQFDTSGNVYDIFPQHTATGTAPVLSGTGACATITTQLGAWTGSFKCTGATAASTVTMTFDTGVATNGWNCAVQDETTRANLLQQTSHSATTCVLTATSITQNDVFTFTAIGF